jgi:two-component system cell cycle sensor histidine kinase/response regulator CckA
MFLQNEKSAPFYNAHSPESPEAFPAQSAAHWRERVLIHSTKPCVAEALVSSGRPVTASHTSTTVLVAEDEPIILAFVAKILRANGFRVLEASDGVDALQQVQRDARSIDLLVTDVRMPRMDGIALTRALTEKNGPVPVLFISGYTFDLEYNDAAASSVCVFLAKPFTRKALLAAVEKCLHPPDTGAGSPG